MLASLDLKFYFAVFMRRLPYFLIVAAFVSAIGITVAFILPPVYRAGASILVEPQQIPGELAQSTATVNPYEQAQIIQQRLLTRANLLALAERLGMYKDQPELTAGDIVAEMRERIEFIGFEPDPTIRPDMQGATIIGIAFEANEPQYALAGANELVNLVLQENVKIRTGRAGETVEFFETEVERLADAIKRQAELISDFKTENVEALPDSLSTRRAQQQREQERLLTLDREEAQLRDQRATALWVYERTGRASIVGELTPEEEELQTLRSHLIQQRAVYAPTSPIIRNLETRLAALQSLVDEQRAARSVPGPDGEAGQPMSELEAELAPIDARLEFIAEERAQIEKTLAELDASIRRTPANETRLAGLERELAALQQQYEEATGSRSRATMGERIEVTARGERFSLVEPPIHPGGPVRPRRVLIAGAGVFGGFGLGFGLVVLLELLNRSIRRPIELTSRLGIEPLATIPYIRTPGEERRRRGVIFAAFAIVLVGIPAVLLALHTYYLPLDLLFSQLMGGGAVTAG
ncbi:MAG TPA: Wzz/FepE/Etk N-terminal domain-containing protein [Gemmatimonadales bacterium]|nr:Wzz/FepE/Etk N-terminal domain-containing protein [Gemmatimonadales bacterium]